MAVRREAGSFVQLDFNTFYEASYRRLYRDVVLLMASASDAEDVLADAYERAAARWERVSRLDNPQAWVRRVAVNRGLDVHRARRRQRRAYALVTAESEQRPDFSLEVLDALNQLPAEQRQAVILHHVMGETVESAAALLRRPSGTVKGHLVKGRSALLAILSPAGVGSDD